MLHVLQSEAFKQAVDQLPGYQADDCGRMAEFADVFATIKSKPVVTVAKKSKPN